MLGPIDYIVVGFAGNNFDGSALRALADATDQEIIRVLDLVFIMKDAEGTIVEGEFEDQSQEVLETLKELNYSYEDAQPLLSDNDVAKIGEQMAPDTAACVLVIEQLWAKDLKRALIDANGFLVAEGRIHPEAVESAMQELHTNA